MLKLYYWPTPNGHKITIFLEETKLKYELSVVDIRKGDQFQAEFLKISPNNRIPALEDSEVQVEGRPLALFESGAILEYLADKTGKFLSPVKDPQRYEILKWLYWQMAGLGPMAGQNHHFALYAPEKIPYAIDRYVKETNRLYGVVNKRLKDRDYVAGEEYSIADMAIYPWIVNHEKQGQDLNQFPHLKAWFEKIQARPAVQKAYEIGKTVNTTPTVNAESAKILFGQTARD